MSRFQISFSRKLLRAGPGHSSLEYFEISAVKLRDRFLCKALISEKANFEVWSRRRKVVEHVKRGDFVEICSTPHFEVSLLGDEGLT